MQRFTRFVNIHVPLGILATLTMALASPSSATAQSSFHRSEHLPISPADFVPPIQATLHWTDQAALELYLTFAITHSNRVSGKYVDLLAEVKALAIKRERLLVTLRLAEHLHYDDQEHRTRDPTVTLFSDATELQSFKDLAKEARETYERLVAYSKSRRHEENTDWRPIVRSSERVLDEQYDVEEVGHPAEFLSFETRAHLEALGLRVPRLDDDTADRTLERPSHLHITPPVKRDELRERLKDAPSSYNMDRLRKQLGIQSNDELSDTP